MSLSLSLHYFSRLQRTLGGIQILGGLFCPPSSRVQEAMAPFEVREYQSFGYLVDMVRCYVDADASPLLLGVVERGDRQQAFEVPPEFIIALGIERRIRSFETRWGASTANGCRNSYQLRYN